MTQKDLLDHLEAELRTSLEEIRRHISGLDLEALQQRSEPESWNILETIAHLNLFLEDYIPAFNRAIHRAKARRWAPTDSVEYSMRGRRLVARANAANGKAFRSAKRYNFSNQDVDQTVLKSFIIKCEQLLRIIQSAREVNLNRPTVPKANAWFAKYKLGNILEFIVLHQRRHLTQAIELLKPAAVSEN